MEAITNIFIYLFLSSGNPLPDYYICEKSISHLSLEDKIEFSIGCSFVNGKRVYSEYTLEEIYGNGEI